MGGCRGLCSLHLLFGYTMTIFREQVDRLIDKGVKHLHQLHEANHKIRFSSLVTFLVHQTDNLSDDRLKNQFFLTALAQIVWYSSEVGKLEL